MTDHQGCQSKTDCQIPHGAAIFILCIWREWIANIPDCRTDAAFVAGVRLFRALQCSTPPGQGSRPAEPHAGQGRAYLQQLETERAEAQTSEGLT